MADKKVAVMRRPFKIIMEVHAILVPMAANRDNVEIMVFSKKNLQMQVKSFDYEL